MIKWYTENNETFKWYYKKIQINTIHYYIKYNLINDTILRNNKI